jgi:hypothetical protein
MSHLLHDLRMMGSEFSDFMFAHMPELPFEIIDPGYGFVTNGYTHWGNTSLRGDMIRYFWTKFITDERLITSHGALTFLNAPTMSPEALSGALNLIMYTINPQWRYNLFGSPIRQLNPELCYSISTGAASYFSMSSDGVFCHAIRRVIQLKGLAPAVFQLFGEDITSEAATRRLSMARLVSGPGGGSPARPRGWGGGGYGGGGGGGGPMYPQPHWGGGGGEAAVEAVVPRHRKLSKYLVSRRLKAVITCAVLTTTRSSLTASRLFRASWILGKSSATIQI